MADYDSNDINAVLSRIETQQEAISEKLDNALILQARRCSECEIWQQHHSKECEERRSKTEMRLAALENWRWYVLGIAVGTAAVLKILSGK